MPSDVTPQQQGPTEPGEVDSRTAAIRCARIMADKKAEDILVLEVVDLIMITHYFVICSASNRRQVQSIADELQMQMKQMSYRMSGQEGYRQGGWVLMD